MLHRYLAKRKYYLRNPPEYQLLPYLLRHHPEKFRLSGNYVEFLERYPSKAAAERKLADLNRIGLVGYFTHKVEEYGVYLFDPLYYDKTEPFASGLKAAVDKKGATGNVLATFFDSVKVNGSLITSKPLT